MKKFANDNNLFSLLKIAVYIAIIAYLFLVWGGASFVVSKAFATAQRVPGDGWRGYMSVCIEVPGKDICQASQLLDPYSSKRACEASNSLFAALVKADMEKVFPKFKTYTVKRCVFEREV